MDTKFSRRDNFVTLNKDIVVEARKGSVPILADVGYKIPISNRVKNTLIPQWGHNANVYMHIMFTNMLVMHVRENLCIIILLLTFGFVHNQSEVFVRKSLIRYLIRHSNTYLKKYNSNVEFCDFLKINCSLNC